MNIIGPDALVFGVDDVAACASYLIDYGLKPVGGDGRRRFEALDGTAIVDPQPDDPRLPAPLGTATMLRETVYGVADASDPRRHRRRTRARPAGQAPDDGAVEAATTSASRWLSGDGAARARLPAEIGQRAGPPRRSAAPTSSASGEEMPAVPRTLSHVVYFVPDFRAPRPSTAAAGLRLTDRFTGVGPFLRPAGTPDHHTLFLIQTPPLHEGLRALHLPHGRPDRAAAGRDPLRREGYQSFWGPGRHKFGSNWFWYFNSPLGCHVEYDADMDLHDDTWAPREAPMGPETRSCSCSSTARSGRRAVRRPARGAAATDDHAARSGAR